MKNGMTKKDLAIAVILIICLCIIWAFIEERKRNLWQDKIIRQLTDENETLKNAYLDLLQQYLLLSEDTPNEIVKELEVLKQEAVNLGRDTHVELGSVIDNVRAGKGTKAVRELGKIIEQSLKQKASNDNTFCKKPTLNNLLEHAMQCAWINPKEYAYAELIREIRNKESHELNVNVKPHRIGLAIFAGIEIIYSLNKLS